MLYSPPAKFKMRDERWIDRFWYVWNNNLFYEPIEDHYNPNKDFINILNDQFKGKISRNGIWWLVNCFNIPEQGWKIHISAHPRNAKRILRIVSEYLAARKIPFKFALDPSILSLLNSKALPRGNTGKFITIYPGSTEQFREVIKDLATMLSGEEGPYILSDMRYKDIKVLYFRYGAFQNKHLIDIMGRKIPAITAPSGELVPDKRDPYFSPPTWVKWPFEDWDASQDDDSDSNLILADKYKILEALHFSNSGGVYLAQDLKTGRKVVLKEARPHTCFNETGDYDSVALLEREWQILNILKDTGIAPKPLDFFQEWEHFYLVEEFVEGMDIRQAIFKKSHPLLKVHPRRRDSILYLKSFFKLFRSFASALRVAHEKSILIGDLSARNFLIKRNSYRVVLLDFEAAFRQSMRSQEAVAVDKPILLFTLGFRRPDRVLAPYEEYDDLYALASIMCYYIFPISIYSVLRSDILHKVYRQILLDMGWPAELHDFIISIFEGEQTLASIIDFLSQKEEPILEKVRLPLRGTFNEKIPRRRRSSCDHSGKTACISEAFDKKRIERWIKKIIGFLEQVADPSEEILFPSDPFVYLTNPLSLGFGTGGVLYVLQRIGYHIPEDWKRWFLDRIVGLDPKEFAPGLLTGLSGIAWVLLELGEAEMAKKVLYYANNHPKLYDDYTFYYGMSGIGMTNLKFFLTLSDSKYLEFAEHLACKLTEKVYKKGSNIYWMNSFSDSTPFTGLGFGQSGVALFLLRLYQITSVKRWKGIGESALHYDLSQGEYIESKKVMSFRDSTGTLEPYVEVGSAGVAKVMLRYGWIEHAQPILNDLYRKYSVLAGYLFGISGLIDALIDAYLFTREVTYLFRITRPLEGLHDLHLFEPKRSSTHLVPPDRAPEGIAVPGEGLLRISCDFGTGCAGVLRVLYRLITLDYDDLLLDEVDQP